MIKDENIEQKIPFAWRNSIQTIVNDIKYRRLAPKTIGENSYNVTPENVKYIYDSIDAYGEVIDDLQDDTWNTSVCRWMGNSWHVLVDLFTLREGASDLVMFADVFEEGEGVRIDVQSVHVP